MSETPEARTYPAGVTSWVDIEQRDVEAAQAFYGGLLDWTFTHPTPPDSPFQYAVGQVDGRDAAGIGGPSDPSSPPPGVPDWHTYIAVDELEPALSAVEGAGGRVLVSPTVAGEGGAWAEIADPTGVVVRLWQAKRRLGAQVSNVPGAWNFSDLRVPDPAAARVFYVEVFGWVFDDLGYATVIRVPGYGDHLAATVDPDIYERQAQVHTPPGFADAIGWLAPTAEGEAPHWHVTFSVADRDEAVRRVEALGGTVLAQDATDWARTALVRDPQGAELTLSQFTPPS